MITLNQDLITIILLVVFFLSTLGLILIGTWAYKNGSSSRKNQRMSRIFETSSDEFKPSPIKNSTNNSKQTIGKFRNWINKTLSSISSEKLKIKLSSAYWTITDTEYILIRISLTVTAFLLGWIIPRNVLGGFFMGAIAYMLPPILLDRTIAKRQQKFHNQLLDVLVLIKGAVQAGYSLMQGLDLAVKEVPAPASEEFGRVLRENRLGITLEGALNNLTDRMENDDLQIVTTAIIINTQVGGSLSTVMEATIATIRDRMQLLGEIRSLTSYARYVGNFLSLMPFITGAAIFFLSPGYFDTVKTELITQIILGMAFMGVVLGNIWIRKIVQIKV